MLINNSQHWVIRPATKRIPGDAYKNPGFTDFTGQFFGSLSVVGYLGKKGAQSTARWLCRCICGEYEPRTGKALKQPTSFNDECCRCSFKRSSAA